MAERPQRQRLFHESPPCVKEGSLYFVTLCAEPRGRNQLCLPQVGTKLLESAVHYHEIQRWWLKLFLLMPDHLHALMSVPKGESLPTMIRVWKAYQAKKLSIGWQSGFFDHRLRSVESLEEKVDYVRMNPVRAGLVAKAEDWAFVWPKAPTICVGDG